MTETPNNRIIKNTGFLYLRMIILMIVKLYTSRVVLQVLGVTDFGVWNAITTLILTFSFISQPFIAAIQRFLNYEMGNGEKRVKQIWATSFFLCIILSLILIILLETIGVWFINNRMNFDSVSINVVDIVFQLSVLSMIIGLMRISYEAAVIAKEKMSAYSILSMLETFILLGIVYLLKHNPLSNQLIFYGILYCSSQFFILIFYQVYTHQKFDFVRISRHIDFSLIKEMGIYSIWNFLGAVGSISASSGINVLLNVFFGVIVNAAYAVTMQVSNAVNQLTNNLTTALNPQLIRSYAERNFERTFSLCTNGCKFSFLLLFLPLFPLWYNLDFVLYLWLGNDVPEYSVKFCRTYFCYLLIASFATPLATTALASPNIKRYQLTLFPLVLCNLIISYIILKQGGPAVSVFYIRVIIEACILIFRLSYLKRTINFPINRFIKHSIIPILKILTPLIIIFYIFSIILRNVYLSHLQILIFSIALFIITYTPLCWMIGLTSHNRISVILHLKRILKK